MMFLHNFLSKIFLVIFLLVVLFIGAVSIFKKDTTQEDQSKVYHVGILSGLDFFLPMSDGFKEKMAELGYVEGKNIVYDFQKAPSIVGNQAIIKKFIDDKVDLIFVYPTEPSIEAKKETEESQIPIVSAGAFVEGNGLIETIQQPGANLTGVRFPVAEIAAKRLELLHKIAPNVKNILVPYLDKYPTVAPAIKAVKLVANSYNVVLIEAPFSSPAEIKPYLDAKLATGNLGFDAILEVPEPLSLNPIYQKEVYAFANSQNVPVAGALVLDGDSGPIFGLLPNPLEFGRLAAPLAVKIFKGAQAGTIPMVTPESELSINVKVLQKLGLEVDEGLLSTAKKVIQ